MEARTLFINNFKKNVNIFLLPLLSLSLLLLNLVRFYCNVELITVKISIYDYYFYIYLI